MDKLDLIETFAAVARENGFSAASRSLGQPLATVSRKVSALEDRIGVQLLTRTTRSVKLTKEGARYLEQAMPLLRALEAAENEVAQAKKSLSGELAIASPVPFGTHILPPVLARFLEIYPDVSIRHVFSNRRSNYIKEGIDLGLRVGPLRDSGMKLLRLGSVRVVTCASPGYLERHGNPDRPENLNAHRTAVFGPFGERARWTFLGPDKTESSVDINPVYRGNSIDALVQLVLLGGGIGWFYSYQVAELIAAGRLKIILREFETNERPVSFLYPDVHHLPQRARTFLDFSEPLLRLKLSELSELIGDE